MNPSQDARWLQTRRTFLGQASHGLGAAALASLLNPQLLAAPPAPEARHWPPGHPWPPAVHPLHFAPRAKAVIFLCMAGGPSHLETLDYKPKLAEMDGQPMPESLTRGQPLAQLQGSELRCMAPQHPFQRYGHSQQEICNLFPQIGSVADEICIVRSMQTLAINHDPAHTFMNTGALISGRPSMGSWFLYGLGSECDNLPGFVVLTSVGGAQDQPIASRQWHSGFLPSRYQGVPFHSQGDPVLYVRNPPGVDEQRQRDVVDAVQQLSQHHQTAVEHPEIASRISQYEMAFRMQTSVPELTDVSDEPEHILELYGTQGSDGTFAGNCLLARRLVERGVRFVHLYHRGWDHHGSIKQGIQTTARLTDQGSAALIKDLKQRGLLDSTLVIWGGEFGRTPMAQGSGRDHHIRGFSLWMAGGGIRPGITYGATDELGYNAVENIVDVHDLHATMLYLMGIDHRRLTVRFQGRDFRLTDVEGHVVRDILA